MSEAHNEKKREYMRALHDKRRAMGICILCSGMIDDTQHSICARCREKKREASVAYRDALRTLRKKCEEVIESEESSIPEDHKCWNCVWGTYVGTGFFCPIIGTCVKDEEEKQEVRS